MSYTAGPAQHPCPPPAGPVQAPQAPNTASPRVPLPSNPLSCPGPLGQLPDLSLDPAGTRPLFSLNPTQPWARASPQGAPRALPSAPHTSQCGDVVMCEAVLPWLPAVLQVPGRSVRPLCPGAPLPHPHRTTALPHSISWPPASATPGTSAPRQPPQPPRSFSPSPQPLTPSKGSHPGPEHRAGGSAQGVGEGVAHRAEPGGGDGGAGHHRLSPSLC